MEGCGENGTVMQRHNSSFGSFQRPSNQLDVPIVGASQMGGHMRHFSSSLSPETGKRPGIPPSHPNNPRTSLSYSQFMGSGMSNWQMGSLNLSPGSSHTRSLSQPSFFSLDSLPPLSPLPSRETSGSSVSDPVSNEVSMEDSAANSHVSSLPSPEVRSRAGLPPRRGHRRSNSDIPLGFSAMIQSTPQLIPIGSKGMFDGSVSGREKAVQLVRQGSNGDRNGSSNPEGKVERKSEGEVVDDLINSYMNFDNIDKVNSSGTEDKDFDSRVSGSKTNGCENSDNEVESGLNGNVNNVRGSSSGFGNGRREGLKRSAGEDIAPTVRHYRSVSMDSYMGSLNFDSESLKSPLPGTQSGQQSPSSSMDGTPNKLGVELISGDFSAAEFKKIMESEKLTEIAMSDPKRAKRILANRQSAARSKERRSRYISELEHKVQTLQTEATTLSAQVTKFQRDFAGLTNQNNELKFRLQAMEQQAQLKDALNEALTTEVQRLKLAAAEMGVEGHLSNRMAQQLSINPQMYQLQQQQTAHLNLYHLQQHQPRHPAQPESLYSQQNEPSSDHTNGSSAEHESSQ